MKPILGTFSGFENPLNSTAWYNANAGISAAMDSARFMTDFSKINDAVQRSMPAIMQFNQAGFNAFRFERDNQQLFNAINFRHDSGLNRFNSSFWYELSQRTESISQAIGRIGVAERMSAIYQNTALLLSQFKSTEDFASKIAPFNSTSGFEFSLGKLSSQIATKAISENDLPFLDSFNDFNIEATQLLDGLSTNVDEPLLGDKINEIITAAVEKFKAKCTKENFNQVAVYISLLVAIIQLCLWAKEVTHSFQPASKVVNDRPVVIVVPPTPVQTYRLTNRKCTVYNKPQSNSRILGSIEAGYAVQFIVSNHNWVYITYSESKSGLIRSGWILKKYLM